MSSFCASHHQLRHHQRWMSYFGVKLHLYCKWHTKMRSCFLLRESAGTGIIILARVWVSSFQESLRLTMTQILSFENFGLDYHHKECQLSLSPSASPSSLFLSDRIAHRQSTQCFPLNKPHVSSQKRSSVWSEEGGERHRKNVERLSVHKDIDVWLREKKEEWKAVG